MDGESEDEEALKMQDPMESNNESFFNNSSLFIFHVDSKLRRLCLEMSESCSDYQTLITTRNKHKYNLDLSQKLIKES